MKTRALKLLAGAAALTLSAQASASALFSLTVQGSTDGISWSNNLNVTDSVPSLQIRVVISTIDGAVNYANSTATGIAPTSTTAIGRSIAGFTDASTRWYGFNFDLATTGSNLTSSILSSVLDAAFISPPGSSTGTLVSGSNLQDVLAVAPVTSVVPIVAGVPTQLWTGTLSVSKGASAQNGDATLITPAFYDLTRAGTAKASTIAFATSNTSGGTSAGVVPFKTTGVNEGGTMNGADPFVNYVPLKITFTDGGPDIIPYPILLGTSAGQKTEAKIVKGPEMTTPPTAVWTEEPVAPVFGAGFGPKPEIISDVLQLEGVPAGTPFVLQMSYIDKDIPDEAKSYEQGHIMIATKNGDVWVPAGTNFVMTAYNDSMPVGTWGVDTVANNVWVVLDHNSYFAVVPEPATLSLLGVAGLGLLARRRKA